MANQGSFIFCAGVSRWSVMMVSLGLHCFLRLAHALYCRSRRCLASVAFSV